MRHARFDIVTLDIEGHVPNLKAVYLVVAANDDGDLQWEVVAYTFDAARLQQRVYELAMTTLEGRALRGEAALVRSVDGAHVFRGIGLVDGVEVDELG